MGSTTCGTPCHSNRSFQVADQDFTHFSVILSVALLVDIPDKISGSWYDGDVHVLFKDSAFEPSSPIRYATELYSLLSEKTLIESALFVFSDGGPDNRVTSISVKPSMIFLFLEFGSGLPLRCLYSTLSLILQPISTNHLNF